VARTAISDGKDCDWNKSDRKAVGRRR
jgi:hypothetical protein